MGSADPLLGTELGNFRLTHILGEGGMGRVYIAEQPRIANRVAIKVMSSQNRDLVARFFAEARAVNLIKHPSIVKVHDLAKLPDGRPYIVMELVEGETLRTLIARDGPLPQGGIAKMMTQVLGALAAAHSVGIVHRDLKPDNVMVTADGTAKVLDFGIAKLSPWLGDAMPRTQTGVRIGTPAYMSPEQIRGGTVDARTDVYAAGIMLFEALTGRRPFRADNEFDLMRGHLEEQPPSPRELRKSVSVEFEQIVKQALAKNPADRFQTATAMANAIDAAAQTLPTEQQRRLVVPPINDTIRVASSPVRELIAAAAPQPVEAHTRNERARRSSADSLAITAVKSGRKPKPQSRPRTKTQAMRPRTPMRMLVAAVIAVPLVVTLVVYLATRPPPVTTKQPTVVTPEPVKQRVPAPPPDPEVEMLPSGIANVRKQVALDPASFDMVAYLPEAQAQARKIIDDAALFNLSAITKPDGKLDLGPQSSTLFTFVSPSRSKMNSDASRLCVVSVRVTATEVVASSVPMNYCGLAVSRIPTCTFAQIRERARARGVKGDAPVMITWVSNAWQFMIRVDGEKPVTMSFDDRCGMPPRP